MGYTRNRKARKDGVRAAVNVELDVDMACKLDHVCWGLMLTKREIFREALQMWFDKKKNVIDKIPPIPVEDNSEVA